MKKSYVCLMIAACLMSKAIASNHADAVSSLEQRIELLESAFLPSSDKALVPTFAKAIQNRNGAVQYMLFCAALKEKQLSTMQSMNWVTGTSSPLLTHFKVNQTSANAYRIDFDVKLQGKVIDHTQSKITLNTESSDGKKHACIASFTSPAD